jgi:flagellar hook-associated protein 2
MSTIQFGGVVSGLNTQGIIDALVAVKKQPLTQLQNKEADLAAQKAAYAQVGAALDDLVTKVKVFTVTAAGARRLATPADPTVFTATAVTGTAVSQHQISVDHLATATTAVSTTAMGAAVTGNVDTSKLLSAANMALPITAGNMAVTVDGTTVQFAVGDPATTTLQSVMTGLAAALQAQIQAQTPGETAMVAASIVGGKIQLSVAGSTATHSISFGDAVHDTSNLASAFGLSGPGVSGALDPKFAGTTYLDPVLSSLNLPGSVTAGQISAIVDGQIVHFNVGNPSTTTLSQTLDGFAAAIQIQLGAGGASVGPDAAARVSATVVDNKLQISITGDGPLVAHSLRFGAAGDTSNALGLFGISNSVVAGANNPTITGAANLGVARMTSSLDTAGLAGLTSTATGKMTINGVEIAYNTASDSMSDLISRINNSSAGVIASVDRSNDQIILTRKDTGAVAIDIADVPSHGNLAAALQLAPGTTNAQVIGDPAQVTVDGRTIVSTSNTVTNALDGVVLTLAKRSPLGEAQTLTIGVDQDSMTTALNSFVTSFNALGDLLDNVTATTPGQAGGTAGTAGPLSSDPMARSIFLELRDILFSPTGSGTLSTLGQLGLSTGAVGSLAGTTDRLQLDTTKLTAALTADAGQVASLLDGSSGPMAAVVAKLKSYEDPSNSNSYIQSHTAGITSEISDLKRQEADRQTMIDSYQAMIEAQYASMEATLSLLQSQSAQINSTLGVSSSTTSGSGLGQSSTS